MMTAALQGITGSSRLSRCVLRAGLLASLSIVSAGLARADCNEDLGKLMSKRMAEIGALNKISKANKGKLDPIAACPRLKNLAADEAAVAAYMTKNKDWCNLPDDLVQKMNDSHVKTASVAVKACGFAVKMKQMQQQQAAQVQQQQQQQAVKLPTGPL
jgi:hypothetical protein